MSATSLVWLLLVVVLVVVLAAGIDRWRLVRKLDEALLKHQSELRVERDTHGAIQSGAQRTIGQLESQLAKAREALSGPIRIPMQSLRHTFLMHDFTIASSTPEDIEHRLRVELERSVRAIEEKAKKELMVVFTDPVVGSFDDVGGRVYTVTVGAFPKFVLAPDGSFEIEGQRVEITMVDEDGRPVETPHPVKIAFLAHPRIR